MGTVNYSHSKTHPSFAQVVRALKEKIMQKGDLPYVSTKKLLAIVEDLSSFRLGRFFLQRKGANGFWTDYIINHPNRRSPTRPVSPIESFILNKCPLTIATQERFKIFQDSIQGLLKEKMILASVPCGVMRDLLTLNFAKLTSFSLIGIDVDAQSLSLAEKLAKKRKLEKHTKLIQADAWNLNIENEIDVLTSNGLNVYISDQQQVMNLYKKFYASLKKNGTLITGVLTHPPDNKDLSEWVLDDLPTEDVMMEKILYQDILECNWRNYKTTKEIYEDFFEAGFKDVKIMYDRYRIFPTVIATK